MGQRIHLWGKAGTFIGPLSASDALALSSGDLEATVVVLTDEAQGAVSLPQSGDSVDFRLERTMLVPSLVLPGSDMLHAVQERMAGKILVLDFVQVQYRTLDVAPDVAITLDDLSSVLAGYRSDDSPDLNEVRKLLWNKLKQSNSTQYAYDLALVDQLISVDPTGVTAEEWMARLTKSRAIRSQYANMLLHSTLLGQNVEQKDREVHTLIEAIDGLGASALLNQTVVANRLAEQAAEAERRRALREAERDRKLTIGATALLLPTLWFSLLGANVFPDEFWGLKVQSGWSTLTMLVVAVMLTVGGLIWSRWKTKAANDD